MRYGAGRRNDGAAADRLDGVDDYQFVFAGSYGGGYVIGRAADRQSQQTTGRAQAFGILFLLDREETDFLQDRSHELAEPAVAAVAPFPEATVHDDDSRVVLGRSLSLCGRGERAVVLDRDGNVTDGVITAGSGADRHGRPAPCADEVGRQG